MKIVLIITDYGAFNNFLAELSSVIAQDKKYTLHVICSKKKVINIKDKALLGKQNIRFHFIDIPRTITLVGQLKAASKIRFLIKSIKPDLIHSHFTTATFSTILFRTGKYPYWSTIHGLGMNSSKGISKLFFSIVEIICFIRLDRIFVVNNQDYNLVKKLFRKKLTKYKCLGFGCDIEKFNPDNFTEFIKKELKRKIGVKEGIIVIAFTGRYVHFKGFNLVIESFKILTEQYPDKFKLILMGGFDSIHKTGLDESGEKFFNNSDDIINLGFTNDVDKYLSITDIFLFPSKKEGLPTCILESLAMGVPVVTFNTRGNNDVIKNNYNGILIQPDEEVNNEVENITNSLKQLAFNVHDRTGFGKNARKDVLKYDRNNFINEHLLYYSELKKNHNN
ncbi:MAG: glycosyltransferase [Chitinophagaceae bacterium]|nr:glycosyltransferase [Chitinophagaceae bacterium]